MTTSTAINAPWYESMSELLPFARALATVRGFGSDFDAVSPAAVSHNVDNVLAYFEKPWKWTPEYERWVRLGRPVGEALRVNANAILQGVHADDVSERQDT